MIVNDIWLKQHPEIFTPFVDSQIREERGKRVISYGLSSAGYDIRLAEEFKVYHKEQVLNPKKELNTDTCYAKEYLIPPNDLVLARSFEWIEMPEDCIGICLGKSSYARVGLVVNVTPLEPGWKGYLTIELSNTSSNPICVFANEGIAQIIIFRIETPEISYGKRNGKYMNQKEVVLPRL